MAKKDDIFILSASNGLVVAAARFPPFALSKSERRRSKTPVAEFDQTRKEKGYETAVHAIQ
jgi:hypothetical protein